MELLYSNKSTTYLSIFIVRMNDSIGRLDSKLIKLRLLGQLRDNFSDRIVTGLRRHCFYVWKRSLAFLNYFQCPNLWNCVGII